MMPEIDFSRLLNNTENERGTQAPVDLDLKPGLNTFKFSFVKQESRLKTFYTEFDETSDQGDEKEENILSNIRGIAYPLFIGVFVIFDCFLLLYRFSWLHKSYRTFKRGIEERVPYNGVTKTVLFILTGKDIPLPKDNWDEMNDYNLLTKEKDFWDDPRMYFIYCQSNVEQKHKILQEQFKKKQRQNPRGADGKRKMGFYDTYVVKIVKIIYRVFRSPVFWRFVLVCGFVLLLCLVTKFTNDLVTMDTAMFLLDTDALVPILERQSDMSGEMIQQHGDYLNALLKGYKVNLDAEVQTLNSMLVSVAERQVSKTSVTRPPLDLKKIDLLVRWSFRMDI